jgi:hypothetical protein
LRGLPPCLAFDGKRPLARPKLYVVSDLRRVGFAFCPAVKDPAKVGELVQIEIGGAFQLEKPKRVRALQELDGVTWVFVDDHEAGVPMEQVTVIEGGKAIPPASDNPPRLPIEAPVGEWREERLLDEAGEEIFVHYKGEPSKERYEFIRDYLDFKIKRMK